jgi:preprotein translocase subunit SecA
MNKQREAIYKMRREVLTASAEKPIREKIYEMMYAEMSQGIDMQTANGITDESLENLAGAVGEFIGKGKEELLQEMKKNLSENVSEDTKREEIKSALFDVMKKAYEEKGAAIGNENIMNLEKAYTLQAIDMLWMDHLDVMDHLRDSVRLRAYGQRDPLVEYKNEAIRLFRNLQGAIQSAIVAAVFRIGIQQLAPHTHQQQTIRNKQQEGTTMSHGSNDFSAKAEVGRNDPCPCGATHPDGRPKKYKHCHGK